MIAAAALYLLAGAILAELASGEAAKQAMPFVPGTYGIIVVCWPALIAMWVVKKVRGR